MPPADSPTQPPPPASAGHPLFPATPRELHSSLRRPSGDTPGQLAELSRRHSHHLCASHLSPADPPRSAPWQADTARRPEAVEPELPIRLDFPKPSPPVSDTR